MYARGKIRGFLHLYIGQEAVATGAISALRPRRLHRHATTASTATRSPAASTPSASWPSCSARRPASAAAAAARCTSSTSRSRSWAATPSSRATCRSPAGSRSPSSTRARDRIAVNFLGDGAVNEGEFHEALNLAAVWKLPVLFICENNFYGMGTAVQRVSASIEVYKRAEAYGIRAEQVDGMDVLAMHEARSAARAARARRRRTRLPRGDHATASAATRWPTRSSTARRTRSSTGASSIRSSSSKTQLLDARHDRRGRHRARCSSDADAMVDEAAAFAEESPHPPLESLRRVYAHARTRRPADA